MTEQILSDIKVLDLTWHLAGPYCTKLLADYGADVIKIERLPGGDPARMMGPFFGDDPHPEKSGVFLHLNTNKRSITLNLKTDAGKKIFKALVKDVDILVEAFSPGVMDRLGLGYEVLEKINPKLVMTSLSNFGQFGPYRDYKASEIVLKAIAGDMHSSGKEGREPLKIAGNLTQYQAGMQAAGATMVGFWAGRYQGIGQHIDIPMNEAYMYNAVNSFPYLTGHAYDGSITDRTAGMFAYPMGPQPCKDGYFDLAGGGFLWFSRTADMLGQPELSEKYGDFMAQRDMELKDEFLTTYCYPYMMEHTKRELFSQGQRSKILCGPIFTMDELLDDPHFKEREAWVEIDHPVVGKLTYPRGPVKMPDFQIRRPAPLLGQHNEEVYRQLGYSQGEMILLKEQGVI